MSTQSPKTLSEKADNNFNAARNFFTLAVVMTAAAIGAHGNPDLFKVAIGGLGLSVGTTLYNAGKGLSRRNQIRQLEHG